MYVDFECNLKTVKIYKGSSTKKYQKHIPCSFAYRFSKPIVVFRGENAAYEFTKANLKEYKYCTEVAKKHFNKNLIMSEEAEEQLTFAGFVKNVWIMTMKKLEIIVT